MTTLHLVRHGETAFNRDGKGLGQADVPLTELGERQAQAVGTAFAAVPVGRILSSPLVRAREVAGAISATTGVPVEIREALTEMDVGETEGLDFADMRARFPEFIRLWSGPHAVDTTLPGGESLRDVADRLAPILSELHSLEAGEVVLVSHNFVLKALLCALLEVPLENFRAFQMDLASITAVTLRNGRVAVRRLNDVCHLDALNLVPAARSV
ncbi:MAG: histidine phosphatase family protein [Chloroflexi bacterium]|nr:histidine phosphatase family protein [Dehalococcoidia bacterium]NJD66702.1 histidine phosphatase family protein [Chloroflexota bacterium]PWB43202.1 MAG: histidine phosphatase family protein [Dehalococcoidia bacterium]